MKGEGLLMESDKMFLMGVINFSPFTTKYLVNSTQYIHKI